MSMKDNNFIKSPKTIWGLSFILLGILFFSILTAVTVGSANISVEQVYRVIIFQIFGIGNPESLSKGAVHDIVWYIRLPRIVLAMLIGICLSTSGVVMQAIVKNPLADPYILGLSSGASLGATAAILLGIGAKLGGNYVGFCAFIGAFITSIMVMILANIGGRANSVRLLLSGMALNAMCSAFSSFIVYFADDAEGIRDITFWLMGSVAGAKWEHIGLIFPVVILGLTFFATQFRTLNLMLLGDEVAVTLGKDLNRYRTIYLVAVSILVGFSVYSSGMIGFVGLIIPHIVRMFTGTDHKKVVIISSLVGGIFLVWADVLSRVIIKGSELPIGVITSLVGAPFFVYLLAKRNYGFGG